MSDLCFVVDFQLKNEVRGLWHLPHIWCFTMSFWVDGNILTGSCSDWVFSNYIFIYFTKNEMVIIFVEWSIGLPLPMDPSSPSELSWIPHVWSLLPRVYRDRDQRSSGNPWAHPGREVRGYIFVCVVSISAVFTLLEKENLKTFNGLNETGKWRVLKQFISSDNVYQRFL